MWRISLQNTDNLLSYFKHTGNFQRIRACLRSCTAPYSQMQNISYKNPCVELQQYLHVPIFKEGDKCFQPSIKSMEYARKLFVPQNNNIQCISKAVNPEKFPIHELPEIAFLGRTNAGKSSLLKAIFSEVPELRIRTSKTPGATKCLLFYQIGNNLCLVDMPGYGIKQPKWCEFTVISYLKSRKNLVKTFFLIDAKEGFETWDDAALQMLKDLKIPFAIVLTKIDEVSDSYRLRHFLHLQQIRDNFKENTCFPQIFMLSSHSSEGLAYFLSFIAHITGNLALTD